jgi:hypothetical protein
VGLCIGIVITAALAWWLAGPDGEEGLSSSGGKNIPAAVTKVEPATAPATVRAPGAPRWEELEKLPPVAVTLSPFQERLLKDAVMVERREIEARSGEPARETRLWRTSFKYPLVREEVWLRADDQGRRLPVRREFSVADHAMVQFPAEATKAQIEAWTKRHKFHVRQALKTAPVYLVAAENGTLSTADAIMSSYRLGFPQAAGQKGTAERDYLVFPTLFPTDTSFTQLWGLHNTGQTGGIVDADIDAPEAWDITTGSREVLVGVIDTGVDRSHPDLLANMWTNPHEIPGNSIDDDGNGFVDDVHGWDFFSNDNNPTDEEGHGTHCAGTIGGVGNNVTGVTGVCWQVSIVGLRFLGPSGGSTSDAIEAVNYSRDLGVDLTSNSWGGGGFSSLLQTAIASAGAAEQLFIAAAGNDGSNVDLSPQYPAGYALNTIVSVASSTSSDTRSSFSNYGATTVDLAAPGSSIYSTVPGSSYATYSGTSMATPHVSGAVALLKSIAPDMSAAEIKTRLLETVDPVAAFASNTLSGGRLNVAQLIEESAGPRPVITVTTIAEEGGNGDGISNPGESLVLRFTVLNRGSEPAQNIVATLSTLANPSSFTITQGSVNVGTLTTGQSVQSATPFRISSQTNLATPLAEEFLITLRHGSPEQTSEHRVSVYLHTSARLEGRVTDAGDGSPIVGATVQVSGSGSFTATSGSDGRYAVTVTDGVYEVRALANGYVTSAPTQLSTPPGLSGLDFSLGVPQLGLTPLELMETVYSGRSVTRTVEMRNRGTAPLEWSLELVNGLLAGAVWQPMTTLPAVEVAAHQASPDTGMAADFKSQDIVTLPAVETPMGALTGVTVGAVSTSWDRSTLLGDLQARGAEIVTLTLPLTEAALAEVDSVIVDDSIANFSAADVTALRDRVMAGAGLLCEADNSGSMTRLNQVLASTGITAAYDGGFGDITFTDIRAHPMTLGVTSLREVAVGASATTSGSAFVLVGTAGGRAHAAVSSLGSGVVVFVGNEISDDANYADGDARRFANQIIDGLVARPVWLTVNASSGVLQPGGVFALSFVMNSGELPAAQYQATALFTTNIPGEAETRLPVIMNLVDAPAISLDQSRVDFGSIVEGVAAQRSVNLRNLGRGALQVSSVMLEGADAASFSLAASSGFSLVSGGQLSLPVTFALNAPLRESSAELVIVSDDPVQPTLRIPLTGTRQLPPNIATFPTNLILELKQGETGTADVVLENKGAGPLAWEAGLGLPPGVVGTRPSWVSLLAVSGIYNPDNRGLVRLNFDTGVLPPAEYRTTLYIASNDVDTPMAQILITLRIIAAQRPVYSQNVSVPDTILGTKRRVQVPVQNLGAKYFQFSAPVSLNTSFRCVSPMPFVVNGGQTKMLEFEFQPRKTGSVAGSIIFTSNLPSRYVFFNLSGKGIRGGALKTTPTSISATLPPWPDVTRTVKIQNTGELPVNWAASLDASASITLETPRSGVLNPGATATLTVNMSAYQRAAGTYRTKLVITNNTAKPRIEVPITFSVTKTAVLEVTPNPVVLTKVWTGQATNSSLQIRNQGNLPLKITAISTTSPRLALTLPSFPHELAPGGRLTLPFKFTVMAVGSYTEQILIKSNVAAARQVQVPVLAEVIPPPVIAITPESMDETVDPGAVVTRTLEVANTGGDTLTWTSTLRDLLGPAVPLASVQTNLTSNAGLLTAALAGAHPLTEGTSGTSIIDGGANMYDTGNILSTDLNSVTPLPYTDGGVNSHASLGAAGRYFTQKNGALWTLAADLQGVARFTISGGLGADGSGSVTGGTFTRHVAGITYRGFYKRVTGTARPSVNHLIILEDRPGLAHQFETNTDSDFHEVTGLSGSTRMFYLMFGLSNGATYAEGSFSLLMDTFLRRVVHPTTFDFLTPATSSGSTCAGDTSPHELTLDTRNLSGGIYSATVRFSSNAPLRSLLDVPVTMRVPSIARLTALPAQLDFPDTFLGSLTTLNYTLSNPGNVPLTITGIATSDPAFTLTNVTLPRTIQPGGTLALTVRFSPSETRSHTADLILTSNASGAAQTLVPLTGKGLLGPRIAVEPTPITLTIDPGTPTNQLLTITNSGDATLQWSAAPSATLASLVAMTTSTSTVPAGSNRQTSFNVSTTVSTAPGTITGWVRFTSNDSTRVNLDVPVTLIIPSRPRLTVTPSSVSFGNTFVGGSSSLSVQVRNVGNAALTITSITGTSLAFDWPTTTLPLTLGSGSTLNFSLRFRPDVATAFTSQIRFTASQSTPSEVVLTASGSGVPPPMISVQPGQINASAQKGQILTPPLSVQNTGGSTLSWQASVLGVSTPSGTLPDVLQRVNASHATVTTLIPNLYLFSEGVTGTNINDGGNDMYDGGNYLNTSLGSALAYSDNVVTTSATLGAGGTYFTRKQPGLFVFVADMNGVSTFNISGNLGADGSGSTSGTTLTRSTGSMNYTGYFKGVSGTTDPSVNHLIIVETKAGISHTYSSNSDNDDHSITGMSGATRLYYLLFARADGRAVDTVLAGTIMDAFLQNIALPPGEAWISLSPAVGNTSAGGSSPVTVKLNTAPLDVGQHTATIRFTSNAPVSSTVDVPVSLEVTPPSLAATPTAIMADVLIDGHADTSTLSLTARDGTTPAWTATASVPWITLSKSTGTGSDTLTLNFAQTLTSGVHQGGVTLTFDGTSVLVPVTVNARVATYRQLHTDYRRPDRLLGLINDGSSNPCLLVSIDAATLVPQAILSLPTNIIDTDLSTDCRFLYALALNARTFIEVDLEAFAITRTMPIPASASVAGGAKLRTGRANRLYYTDTSAALHVYDTTTGQDLSTFLLPGSIGIESFEVTPDGNVIYARSRNVSGNSYLARVNSNGDILTQTHASAAVLPTTGSGVSPTFISASRDAITAGNRVFTALLESSQSVGSDPIWAASAYGGAVLSYNRLKFNPSGSTAITLTGTNSITVAAFTQAQDALVYYLSDTQRLIRVPLTGIITLPPAAITPLVTDGAIINGPPSSLSWTGSPMAASYDVFLGTDPTAVAAATNFAGGIYRGNTTGVNFTLGSSNYVPGQTYYWRIDIRNFDGTTIAGPVWSFRLPAVNPAPTKISATGAAMEGNPIVMTLDLSATTPSTAWTLSESVSWLSLSATSGTGAQTITVTIDPSSLGNGTTTTSITLTTGADTLQIPVTFRTHGILDITRMMADPTLPFVYALHRESTTNEGWLLWIDPVTARTLYAIAIDANIIDFTVHAGDDRIYLLAGNGSRVVGIERQGNHRITGTWNTASTAAAIHNGAVGRVVMRSTTNVLQMHHSGTGGTVGSSVSLPANATTRTPGSGSFIAAAVQQSTSVTGIARYNLSSSAITYFSTQYWTGTYSPVFTLSGDGSRAIYLGRVYDATTLTNLYDLATPIHAASWRGHIGWSSTQGYSTASGATVGTLPFSTTLMAATADDSRLVLCNPSSVLSNKFISIVPHAIVVSPSLLALGSIPASSPTSQSLTVQNLTPLDLTYTFASTSTTVTGPVSPFTVNAWQSAQISVTCTPQTTGNITAHLTLTAAGRPEWDKAVSFSANATNDIASTIGFEIGAPAAGAQMGGVTYTENGYFFTSPQKLLRIGPNHANRPNNGTAHVAPLSGQSPLTITRPGGGTFSLISVDLAEYSTVFPTPMNIPWTGTTATGQTVTTTFRIDGIIDGTGPIADFQIFTFPATFQNLVSASVSVTPYAFDNLSVLTNDSSAASTTASSAASSSRIILDTDSDGIHDFEAQPSNSLPGANGTRIHLFDCRHLPTTDLAHITVQASSDGSTWSDLTRGLDYTWQPSETGSEKGWQQGQLHIPTSADIPWEFRLVRQP